VRLSLFPSAWERKLSVQSHFSRCAVQEIPTMQMPVFLSYEGYFDSARFDMAGNTVLNRMVK